MTNLKLADRYFQAMQAAKDAQAAADFLKAEIKALGLEELEGEFCTISYKRHERKTFDSKKAAGYLTEQQIMECQKVGLVETLKVNAKIVE
jgi:hypothetical protein